MGGRAHGRRALRQAHPDRRDHRPVPGVGPWHGHRRDRRRQARRPQVVRTRRDLPRVLPRPLARRGGAVAIGTDRRRDRCTDRARTDPTAAARPADPDRRERSATRVAARMTAAWITVAALTVATIAIKAAGPALVGGRDLPPAVMRVIGLLAPALLAALIVWETFGGRGRSLTVDARAAGLAAAGVVLVLSDSLVGAIISAAGVTALVRLIA